MTLLLLRKARYPRRMTLLRGSYKKIEETMNTFFRFNQHSSRLPSPRQLPVREGVGRGV